MTNLSDARFNALRAQGFTGDTSRMLMDWLLQNTPVSLLENRLGIRWVYEFNGTNMYATMPEWTPLGLPFEVSVEAVPLTVDDSFPVLVAGNDPDPQMFISTAPNHLIASRALGSDGTTVVNMNSGVPGAVVGTPYKITKEVTGAGTSFTVTNSGAGQEVATLSPSAYLLNDIATRNGNNLFHGPIWNLRLTDSSPFQRGGGRPVNYGNATRYGQLENPITWNSGEASVEIEWSHIRPAQTFENTAIVSNNGTAASGDTNIYVVGTNSSNIIVRLGGGNDYSFVGALSDVAVGQHYRGKLVATPTNWQLYIDGALKEDTAVSAAQQGSAAISHIGVNQNSSGFPIPANSALGDIIIRDLTNDREWIYTLDEGTGTAINNTGKTQGNYLNQPLWERQTLDQNNTRTIDIPAFDFTGGGTVTMSVIYDDGTFLDGSVPVLTGVAGVITAGANVSNIKVDGVAYAGAVIPTGQHIDIEFDVSAGTVDTIGPIASGAIGDLIMEVA